MPETETNRLLDPREAAALLGVAPGTLKYWRVQGYGPRFLKLGSGRKGRCRYLLYDLWQWIDERAAAQQRNSQREALAAR